MGETWEGLILIQLDDIFFMHWWFNRKKKLLDLLRYEQSSAVEVDVLLGAW